MGGESSMFLMGAARRGTAQPDPHTSPISVLNRWEGLWRAGAAARGECRMQTTHDYSICPYFEGKDRRCARRFNLQCIAEVYDECLGRFQNCGIYQDLTCGHTDIAAGDVRAA